MDTTPIVNIRKRFASELEGSVKYLASDLRGATSDGISSAKSARLSHGPNPVDERVRVLLNAVAKGKTTNDTCALMLREMVPGSLGAAKDNRDEFQNRGAAIIGTELSQMEADYVSIKEYYENIIAQLETHLASLTSSSGGTDELGKQENDILERLRQIRGFIAQEARKQSTADQDVQQAIQQLEEAQRKLRAELMQDLEAATKKRDRFDGAIKKYFIPLRDDAGLSEATRRSHVKNLTDLFKGELDCEDCLVAGFEPSAMITPHERGNWSRHVFEVLWDIMKKKIEDLEAKARQVEADLHAQMSEPKGRVDELELELNEKRGIIQAIKDSIERLRINERELLEQLELIRKQISEHQKGVKINRERIRMIKQSIDMVKRELSTVTTALQSFTEAMEAYRWLLEHSFQECQRTAEETYVVGYDPQVRDRIKSLDHPLKNLQERSLKCREMLVFSAPGCLCPAPSERRQSQRDECIVIRDALQAQEKLLKKAVCDIVNETEGQIPDSEMQAVLNVGTCEDSNGMATASNLVAEKHQNMQKADRRHSEALNAMAEVESKLNAAKLAVKPAENLLKWIDSTIKMHFVPLKESAVMSDKEAEQHLTALMDLLEGRWRLGDLHFTQSDMHVWIDMFKFEDCLLRGLRPALKHRPGQRHKFCKRIVEVTGCQIEAKLPELQAKLRELLMVVEEWEGKRSTAQQHVNDAKAHAEITKSLYERWKSLLPYVTELAEFRSNVLTAFNWLHTRGLNIETPAVATSLINIIKKEFNLREMIEVREETRVSVG